MSVLKLVLIVVFVVVVLYFGFLNIEERITLRLAPGTAGEYRDISLAVALFTAFLAGIVVFALVSFVRDLQTRSQIGKLRKENRKLLDELQKLRSVTLDDLPMHDDADEDARGDLP